MPEKIIKNIIVKGSTREVFSIWENFENFPYFMKNIKEVHKSGDNISHWVMSGPLGKDLKWDARTTDVQPNKRIAWKSISGGDLQTSGQVTFNELDNNETDVTVHMQYTPPAGKAGETLAHVFDNPEGRLEEDLRSFKRFAEQHALSHS